MIVTVNLVWTYISDCIRYINTFPRVWICVDQKSEAKTSMFCFGGLFLLPSVLRGKTWNTCTSCGLNKPGCCFPILPGYSLDPFFNVWNWKKEWYVKTWCWCYLPKEEWGSSVSLGQDRAVSWKHSWRYICTLFW